MTDKSHFETEVREESSYDDIEHGIGPQITQKDLVVDGDVALSKKMFLINNALDDIGFTWYHFKLFCIAGFGYSADSQLEMIQSSVKTVVDRQFNQTYPVATEMFYVGLILGSVFWGFGGDIIGRKTAFNYSLLLAASFGFVAGGMNSYPTYCLFMALSAFCAGGNIALDVTVFLEFSPSKYSWITTFMAAWWGVGMTIATVVAWAFIPNYSCDSSDDCPSSKNRGWRYCWYTNSAIVMVCALARLFVLKLDETPKYLVSNGKDEEAVEALRKIAEKYNKPFTLTVEQLHECGEVSDARYFEEHGYTIKSVWHSVKEHCKVLYLNKTVAYSSTLIFLSWFIIGVAYSTFYNFLYIYIALHGGNTGSTSYITYRNSVIANFMGIFGPMAAAYLVTFRRIGRKGTMTIGALSAMAILFGYTTVRTLAGDAGFGGATYFTVNIYYGVLYAYTPEVFPAVARTTGGALALVAARVSGALAPVIYYYGANSGSAVPIWVCGGLIGCLGFISLLLPFEPTKKRSV